MHKFPQCVLDLLVAFLLPNNVTRAISKVIGFSCQFKSHSGGVQLLKILEDLIFQLILTQVNHL